MAVLFDSGIFSVIGLNSELLVGSELYWYAAGTSTPLNTYSDNALTLLNPNPVVVGADGRFPAIYLQNADYKLILKDAGGVTLVTRDHISGKSSLGQTGILESIFPYTESLSTFCVQSPDGNYAATFFSQTSDNSNAGSMSTIGGGFFTVNDNTSDISTSYSIYAEARPHASAGRAHVAELNMVSLRTGVAIGPNDTNGTFDLTEVLRLSSGRQDVGGSLPVSSYITIVPNGSTGKNGIVFNEDALDSNKQAIVMAEDYKFIFTERTTGTHHSEFTGTYRYNRVDSNSAWYEETFFRARASGADTQTGDVIGRISFDKFASSVASSVGYINVLMKGASGGQFDIHARNAAGTDVAISFHGNGDNSFGPNADGISSATSLHPWSVVYANQFWIGGALKTLSVDGSGFVKAA